MARKRRIYITRDLPRNFSRSFSSISERIRGLNFKKRFRTYYSRASAFIKRRPMASFFIALGILFAVIVLNSFLTPKPKEIQATPPPKEVSVYKIGTAPKVSFSAKVDKKGVIQIIAQTPGIVSSINVSEGQEITQGTVLVSLANNYQGGNALSVARQIAQDQYNNTKDTYAAQTDIINKQKIIADQNRENTDKLREITEQSIAETQGLVNYNSGILDTLNQNLTALQNTNVNGSNDQAILALRGQIAQVSGALAQLNSAQRQMQYQADTSNPPTALADLGHDSTIRQLEVQQKMLDLGIEASRLGLVMAQINEATMYPAAPFDGVVEKIHVSIGQAVNPGMPLVTFSGNNRHATATAIIPLDTAKKVSKVEDSLVYIKDAQYSLAPEYVSNEATDGLLNSVVFALPDEVYQDLTDKEYVRVDIPIGYADTIATIPYIPIDIVFQTQDGAFVYVVKNNKAVSRKVVLGDLVGGNVAVISGLSSHDLVILDRTVIEGEKVKVAD